MVAVLNFGSQFAHLIARRVRDLGVRAEILPFNTPAAAIKKLKPSGLILSGSPSSVLEKGSPRPDPGIFKLGLPILGICYGEQVMAKMLGGSVKAGEKKEFGKETIRFPERTGLFEGIGEMETVWFSHGDQVTRLPKGFERVGSTFNCPNAAIAHSSKPMWAIQFHPEVTHTVRGKRILDNFLNICRAKRDWKLSAVADEAVEEIRRTVGNDHVVIGISGGVDSLVAGTLLERAIGTRLHAVLVDTGLLRRGEASFVTRELRKRKFSLRVVHAEKMFLDRLAGVIDPEKKRQIIGHTFIEIFEKVIRTDLSKLPVKFLAQGTIYPDRIESAAPGGNAAKIKSHHNLTLPEKMGFKILEPLRDLYKDEVRDLGQLLGVPRDLLYRHPFPGPGLAVRIVGDVTPDRVEILQHADAIFIDELRSSGEYDRIWQAFAVLLPLKTVGVQGDARTYEYMVSLRAVDSVDGMTADWHKISPDLLERISGRIVNEVRGVNRVLYDITQKPPATIEYE